MKHIVAVLLVALLIGCTTTDPNTGEKAFDPVKTKAVLGPSRSIIALGVVVSGQKDPNTVSAFTMAGDVIRAALSDGITERSEILRRISEIKIDGVDTTMNNLIVMTTAQSMLDWWDMLMADVVSNQIQASQASRVLLEIILEGIDMGLTADASGGTL